MCAQGPFSARVFPALICLIFLVDLIPVFGTRPSMISDEVNRSHFLSQTRLEVLGSVSPFLLD